VVYAALPDWRNRMVAEDGPVENATAVFYGLGAGIAALALLRSRGRGWPWWYAGVPLLSLLGCLDELSWGERIFGLQMPELLGTRFDTLHDIGVVLKNAVASRVLLASLALVLIVMGGLGLRFGWWPRLLRLCAREPVVQLLALAILSGLVAQVIDFEFAHARAMFAIEESLEMVAGLGMLFAGLAVRAEVAQGRPEADPAQPA
jgi:hypothetical protein